MSVPDRSPSTSERRHIWSNSLNPADVLLSALKTQVKFSDEDAVRIARHLDMDVDEFVKIFLDPDDEDGPYKVRGKPCPFLGDDDRCKIYDVRPTVCREYPHTDKEGFTFRTMGVANNALVCPAVFWIVEEMKKRSGYREGLS